MDSYSAYSSDSARSLKHIDVRVAAAPNAVAEHIAKLVVSVAAQPFGAEPRPLNVVATKNPTLVRPHSPVIS
jgi:hypothetical protein